MINYPALQELLTQSPIKSEKEVSFALAGNTSIMGITVELPSGEITTVSINDLLQQRWDCIGLQILIQDWCIQQRGI